MAAFESFPLLALGMAFLGTGLGFTMPAISAGASLAVKPEEQGAVAGMIAACPAMGFIVGPLTAGSLYQIHGPLAAIFSAAVFMAVLLWLSRWKQGDYPDA